MSDTALERSNNSTRAHIPALDGVRAVAIGLVMLRHFADPVPRDIGGRILTLVTYGGPVGVDLFFVLSGFLITGICLDHQGPGFFKAFYARRALRIVPPYAALLVVLAAVSLVTTGHGLKAAVWLSTFSANIVVARADSWLAVPAGTSHLWSIAVEEQFYVVWPLVVALCPFRRWVAVLAIPVAFAFRLAMIPRSPAYLAAYVLTPARMDALAVGALIAFAYRDPVLWPRIARAVARGAQAPLRYWVFALLILCGSISMATEMADPRIVRVCLPTIAAIAFGAGLVAILCASRAAPVVSALSARAMRAVGRRSYAMYLFHVPVYVGAHAIGIAPESWSAILAFIVVASAVTYGLSALSWRLIERPCLSLKDAFPYGRAVLSPAVA